MYESLKTFLGCPCTELPAGTPVREIMKAYRAAKARSAQEGFVPVLVAAEAWEAMIDPRDKEETKSPTAYLRVLRDRMPDSKTYFAEQIAFAKGVARAYSNDWPDNDSKGPMEGGYTIDRFLGVCDCHNKTISLLLAEIPAEHPWEVFAWIPLGGWNGCPDDHEQMAAAKYWFEKYGAVPAVITRNVLEYDLPAPVTREQAWDLAVEQFTFCPDIVLRGYQNIGELADTLWRSDKWFFWWD